MNNESDLNTNDYFQLQASVSVQRQRYFGLPAVRLTEQESKIENVRSENDVSSRVQDVRR
jgi:hypothetical protein